MKIKIVFLLVVTFINGYSQEKLNPVNSSFGKNNLDYYKFLNSKLVTNNRDLEVARLIIIPYKEAESCLTLKNREFEGMDDFSNIEKFNEALERNRDNYELVYKEAYGSINFEKKRNWRKVQFKTTKKEISAQLGNLLSNLYEKVLRTTRYPHNDINDTHRSLYYFYSKKRVVMEGYTYEPYDEASIIGSIIDLNFNIILYIKVGGKELENKIISELKELNDRIK